ncbi:conserved hypothetical protein [Culex quinquefasciatus]|uniref:Uncharacterized protein n=1 Tax=Culex quinquefasciatus TaxID=7176 RepID=B0X9S0_CULQU|nr:conserved hypothetical protein [Culex quinquefasciatus]|eukprot:XP_001866392.1 conserved hypothetical protein [Culex quinquefasciatus]
MPYGWWFPRLMFSIPSLRSRRNHPGLRVDPIVSSEDRGRLFGELPFPESGEDRDCFFFNFLPPTLPGDILPLLLADPAAG